MRNSWSANIYFQLQKAIGSKVKQYYREFLDLEQTSPQYLRKLETTRLQNLISHSVQNIPFYKKLNIPEDKLEISSFPILTKSKIGQYYLDLMSDSLRQEYLKFKKAKGFYDWIQVQSGGTSGIPTTVIHSKDYRDRGRAGRLYSQYLCGFPAGIPYFKLWGSMKEISESRDSLIKRISSALLRDQILNAFRMGDKEIESYIEIINSSNINYLMAYIDAAYELARYARSINKPVRPLKSIMGCAGTVTYEFRTVIEEVFQGKVYNKYGSRDCAEIACECSDGSIHIYSNNPHLEIVGPDGHPVKPGETGRILITLLSNLSFPIIRYEIGDMGAISEDLCSCGRPFPVLERLEGRTSEFLLTNTEGYVSPLYIRHLIGVVHNPGYIKKYQLIQNSLIEFELKLVLGEISPQNDLEDLKYRIIRDLKAVLGHKSNISINTVEEISLTKSGKFLYTINNLN